MYMYYLRGGYSRPVPTSVGRTLYMGSRTRVMKTGQNVRQLAQCFHTLNIHVHTNRVSTGIYSTSLKFIGHTP